MQLTFATVIFSGEIASWQLQAKSMARFLPLELVGEILVFINDVDEARLRNEIQKMIHLYGRLSDLVKIIPSETAHPNDIDLMQGINIDYLNRTYQSRYKHRAVHGGWGKFRGWRMQQAFKLASARLATHNFIVILDAKDFFLADIVEEDFVMDGLATVRLGIANQRHKDWLPPSFDAIGAKYSEDVLATVLPNTTPICVDRKLILYALEELERVNSCTIAQYFALETSKATEFGIIGAASWKIGGGIRKWFKRSKLQKIATYKSYDAGKIHAKIHKLSDQQYKIAGIHRSSWGKFGQREWDDFSEVLIAKGLSTRQDIRNLIKDLIIQQ